MINTITLITLIINFTISVCHLMSMFLNMFLMAVHLAFVSLTIPMLTVRIEILKDHIMNLKLQSWHSCKSIFTVNKQSCDVSKCGKAQKGPGHINHTATLLALAVVLKRNMLLQ